MSQADNHSLTTPELHEVPIFKHVNERLISMPEEEEGYKICTNTTLANALDKLGGSPFMTYVLRSVWGYNFAIHVKGEKAGRWIKPHVSMFQKHAIPSPFGRAEEIGVDPSYGNGAELRVEDLSFPGLSTTFSNPYESVIGSIECNLAYVMFVGKKLQIKLHKLAIYEEGAHIDWHRDSTHSDAHRAMMLFALNTEWEGGELMLMHQSVEMSVDLHPTTSRHSKNLRPVIVAFDKDTEYKVMPVTKGTQLMLQYDVNVIGEMPQLSPYDNEEPLEYLSSRGKLLEFNTMYPSIPNNALFRAVANEIQELHERGTKTVAFPLFHLYHEASFKREYLKVPDSLLFDALKDRFDISIGPIVIYYIDEGEVGTTGCIAYRYSTLPKLKEEVITEDDDSEFGEEYDSQLEADDECPSSEGEFAYDNTYGTTTGKVIKDASFHLPRVSAIERISEQPLVDMAYKQNQRGEMRYFGAGMFVKQKDETDSLVYERGMVKRMSDSDENDRRGVKKRKVG
ncbi:hypothetical protein K503DRAFT_804176 [Rhizopogon vinicolor AM-OR11-026]|uniref:Fe2OG dioxygenase domain-containing protein n=1 Tax=Rhizopogon vinicolor AM-OR11-026 TaxID=1314800 RepID=A0A1B7MM83_9AGAM|nr:hypothetical protein K503DRAFT_804176 [Rhizopogon vinicolor AM-OR11-026]